MKPRFVKKCPECKSTDIALWLGGSAGVIYFCKECGYRGPLIIEEYLLSENKGSE